jgi:release factor glutamine methyltransferase
MRSLKNSNNMRELVTAVSKELAIARDEAELVIATLMNRPRFELYMSDVLEDKEKDILWSKIVQLRKGVPIEYVTRRVQFRDHTLRIRPGVFIPRLETEYFAEIIPKMLTQEPKRILEIGTGCGAISVALARFFPHAEILATDISQVALENARENIDELGLNAQISVIRCNMFGGLTGKFDLIISNPPYVPSTRLHELPRSVREFEPLVAIDGGIGGLEFIKRIILSSREYLDDAGVVALEIDEESVEALKKFLGRGNIVSYAFCRDLFNKYRYLFTGAINEES